MNRSIVSRCWLGALAAPLLAASLLLGCAGPSALQRPAQDFYDATARLSDAEEQVLADLNTSIARSHERRMQADYVMGKRIDVTARPTLIPDASIDARMKAVEAVRLYAQKLLALAGSEENQAVDEYSEGTAKSVSKLLPNSVPAAAMAAVTAAFTGIANLVLDRERYKTAVAAAKAAQPHLETLAALLKNDDEFVKTPLQAAATLDGAAMSQILEHIRADRQVPKDRLLQAYLSLTGGGRVADLSVEQTAVDALAADVVRANAALAKGEQRSFGVLARSSVDRAKDMAAVFRTVKKAD